MNRRPNVKSFDSPILNAIVYGVNAPTPHNTQAWKFKILSDSEMLLYIDETRLLPMTDPPARQIHIGSGCFIETLVIGAAELGYETKVTLFPEGGYELKEIGQKPVAKLSLSKSNHVQKDPLFSYIYTRQTNRKFYQGALVTDQEFVDIRELIGDSHAQITLLNQQEKMKPFLDIFYKAMEIESTTRHLWEQTRIWFRGSEKERARKRDGLSVPQFGIDGLKKFFSELYLNKGNPKRWFSDRNIKISLNNYREGIESSKGIVFLKTTTNNQLDWVKTGRTYARFHLAITKFGFYSHPYNQVLQEYPEMSALQKEFNSLLNMKEPEKIQMVVRIGRGKKPYVTYRRHLQDCIIP